MLTMARSQAWSVTIAMWLIGAVGMFLHPEVTAYDKGNESEALEWIVG